jgi:hypothetical protein
MQNVYYYVLMTYEELFLSPNNEADAEHIVLTDSTRKVKYKVAIDDELLSAVLASHNEKNDKQETWSPKQIQTSLRAGVSIDNIVKATKLDKEIVESYSVPVEAEKRYAVSEFRQTDIPTPNGTRKIGAVITEYLVNNDMKNESWDAVRFKDKPWEIRMYIEEPQKKMAIWLWDLHTGMVKATNEVAKDILDTFLSTYDGKEPNIGYNKQHSILRVESDVADSANPTVEESVAENVNDVEIAAGAGQLLSQILDKSSPDANQKEPGNSKEHGAKSDASDAGKARQTKSTHASFDNNGVKTADKPQKKVNEITNPIIKLSYTSEFSAKDVSEKAKDKKHKKKRASLPSWDEIVFGSDNT